MNQHKFQRREEREKRKKEILEDTKSSITTLPVP
jgi:hypothetical protein